jgi:hypothetical protein
VSEGEAEGHSIDKKSSEGKKSTMIHCTYIKETTISHQRPWYHGDDRVWNFFNAGFGVAL